MSVPAPPLRRECPKLTQEEFDDAVRTNMEDFDMDADEAVKSAVDEFALQNYDMGAVVKTAAGKELANHPVALTTTTIREAKTTEEKASAVAQLHATLDAAAAEGAEKLQEVSAVALRSGSLAAVLRSIQSSDFFAGHVLQSASTSGGEAGSEVPVSTPHDPSSLLAPLSLARRLMSCSLDIRDSFDDVGGPEMVMHLHGQLSNDHKVQAELARLAESACLKEEQNKEQIVQAGYALSLVELLQQEPCTLTEDLVGSACGVLRAVCTADDERPPTSKAFPHARLLAHDNQALKTLLALLKGIMAGWDIDAKSSSSGDSSQAASTPAPLPSFVLVPPTRPSLPEASASTVSAVLACARQLAANEEICKSFNDDGGVLTVLALIRRLSAPQHRDVVRAGLGALRQLSNSDGTKTLLAEHDAPLTLLQCAGSHPNDEDVAEPVLGVLAAMTLRQPAISAQCAEAGVVDWVIECLTDMAASMPVCRQACILMRNMVVRNPELRPTYLEKGAEELVRAAKAAHPTQCKDVGSAALRDLGLDNYND